MNTTEKILTLDELKSMHDRAYEHNKITRERAADDLVFYWVTNWDEATLGATLGYKGEFNIIRKGGRQIISDLRSNPVQVNFSEKNLESKDDGDLVDGLYRTSTNKNASIEAFDNAKQETVVCGIGGWELYADYETSLMGDKNQEINRRPIHEFNNTAFPDPGSVLIDKSDANYYSILVPYTKKGMDDLVKELTGDDSNVSSSTFKDPEHSYTFPWVTGQDEVFYVSRFYYRTKIKDKVLTLDDGNGQVVNVLKTSVNEILDELMDDGYKITDEKDITRYAIRLYIANGEKILDHYEIPGDHIPVIPSYGERAIVEGEEHYEGCTRLAKDPQRLRNFQLSYITDLVSRTPRPQPIFFPEQIEGFADMYNTTGADSYLPYLLQNRFDANKNELPFGPAQMPEQQIPTALMESIALTREAVGDVVPSGMPQDISEIDLSGEALKRLQNKFDEQSLVYQQNHKHALRRDGEVFASMASRVYDSPRSVTVTKPDGTRVKKQLMESVIDAETGELVVLNDITNREFDVYSEIGPSYVTKKEETFDKLDGMIEKAAIVNPALAEMLFLKQIEMFDGLNFDDVRKYVRKQSLIKGFVEPDEEKPEELEIVQQAQQSNQPDANLIAAQAMDKEASAKGAEVQRKANADQEKVKTDMLRGEVDRFDAVTRRQAVQIDAHEADANINFKRIDTMTKRLSEINKGNLRGIAQISQNRVLEYDTYTGDFR